MKIFKSPVWLICLLLILTVVSYWAFYATDRYVSKSNIVLESPQIALPTLDISSLFSNSNGQSADMLLLRDYLLSVDMLRKVETAVDFRKHYSDKQHDFFSRLYDEDAPIEELHEYYLNRVSVELDDYAQVLRIKVQAFVPEVAQQIVKLLLEQGEAHMNALGQRLAEEQVRFLELQVNQLGEHFNKARLELLDYQNEKGLISPVGTVKSLNEVVGGLEAQLANLKTSRRALVSYQSLKSPAVVKTDIEIKAVKQQIAQELGRMAQASGGALNTLSSEYQLLQLQLEFAQQSYSGGLSALQNTRIEAARKLKQISILQYPTLPEYSVEPDRLYNSVVFTILALFVALITQMLVLIVKEHQD
jgi:capsular polysaccharide transport system permease protein